MSSSIDEGRQTPPWRFVLAQIAALATACATVIPIERERIGAAAEFGIGGWFNEMNLDSTPFVLLLAVLPLFWFARRSLWRSRRVRQLNESGVRRQTEAPGGGRAAELVQDAAAVHRSAGWVGSLFNRLRLAVFGRRLSAGTCDRRAWAFALLVFGASLGVSAWTASRPVGGAGGAAFGSLPPAYHDEYSYLFQAKTFLAGRLWFPQVPEIFDQVHVLNDRGRFASRFFPGTGAWMAPFVAIGRPYWGHWLAGGLTAFFIFWAGRELGGNRVGLWAGLLTAFSPGMALFGNLLLAHHPGLAGLGLFLFAFLRMMRTRCGGCGLAAGCGLALAMLCRPMTAAGFALPFGIWLAWRIIRGWPGSREAGAAPIQGPPADSGSPRVDWPIGRRLLLGGSVALPLVVGLAIQAGYNRALTGLWLQTPYQLYTEIYTPRHVYGFNNVERGERRLGPKVLDNYDRWAENLRPVLFERGPSGRYRPSLAVRNVWSRLTASFRWSLALVPLSMAAVAFLILGPGRERRWWLVFASIVSLHLVHIPYWYDGIMHWHYVFETGPLWLLLFAATTARILDYWQRVWRPLMPVWWGLVAVVSVLATYMALPPFWSHSRLEGEIATVAFSRVRYAAFRQLLENRIERKPALVLVEPDPSDRHIDYVTNDPPLDSPILIGRYRPGRTDLETVCRQFPNRSCYLYRVPSHEWIAVKSER